MPQRKLTGLFAVLAGLLLAIASPRGANADGLIVINNPPVVVPGHFSFAPLEVTYHKVDCAIKDQAAVTTVDQEFYNPNNARLEGEYLFPVPKDAQINKFTMDIDGKPVEAELLPADKARKIYEDIVRASKDPALLEYAGRAMFKVRIFPIDPLGKKHITLKYTEFLKQDNGLLDYHYTLNTEKFSSKPLQNVSIKVTIDTTDPITTLYSPTHDVEIIRPKENQTHAVVSYEAKNVRPDTDFHLFIGRKQTPVGINLMTYRPDPTKDGYFVLMAAPIIDKNNKPMPKDVVFVMDTSGSMSGAKIDQARKALKYCVETLNPEDHFDIVRFSTEAEPFFSALKPASDDNRKKAADYAVGLSAAGGTAIDEALQKALTEVNQNLTDKPGVAQPVRMIVFMTDGQPTVGEQNPDTILDHVKKSPNAAGVRIFSFGVGNDVNTKLLDLVAEQTRGYSQYVLPNENLEIAMSNFWGKVQDPILANLKLDTGAVQISKIYPKELPDLFKGDQLVVFGTYSKAANGAVTITGFANGKEAKFAQDVFFQEKTDSSNEWIAKLWATRRVAYLLDEIRLHGENKELKDEVVELARRWAIVTPYTAMLIIEDEKARNIPVAQRSLREMEQDRHAVATSDATFDSLKHGEASGEQAVGNSISQNGGRSVGNLEESKALAAQEKQRTRGNDKAKADLDNADSPAAATMPAGAGYGGQIGGADAKDLNLGTNSVNGWQNGNSRVLSASGALEAPTGYRVVTNYAQQSRVVNNRAFFLNGNQWTDSQSQTVKEKTVKITFNSDGYFDLLKAHPEAAQYLALGTNLTLELDGTIYNITEDPTPNTPAAK